MSAPYLANFGGRIFVPENSNPRERMGDYAIAFISENEKLDALLCAAWDLGTDKLLEFLRSMSPGMRALYALPIFDWQVGNGGVAQFYTNKYWLAAEVISALDYLKAKTILNEFKKIDDFINADPHLLHATIKARDSGDDDDANTAAWYAFVESIDHLARPFEGEYHPNWLERDIHNKPTPGPYQLEMCKKCCDYIETHLYEFQVFTKN